jgi:hypothetical protein
LSKHTISEELFEQLCLSSGVPCEQVQTGVGRTPDFRIRSGDVEVFCEVKQIDPNVEDLADMADDALAETVGRLVPNRVRKKLKDVSGQLKAASRDGHPTLLVLYDNTGLFYTMHSDVIQAMFGQDSVMVTISGNPGQSAAVSEPFLGGNRGLTHNQNTSVSALAILDGSDSYLALRVYHNPYAVVVLQREVLAPFPVTFC